MENTLRILPFVKISTVTQQVSSSAPVLNGSFCAEAFVMNGPSAAIAKLWEQLHRVAPYFRTALLTGEDGTGADFVARALHAASPFRDKPLRLLSADAAETGFASGGVFSRGGGNGVYFFEDVERLSSAAQQGLLQFIKARSARSARIIAFAHSDLRALVGAGRFSSELAASLGTLRLALPSLRDRREDIPSLAQAITSLCAERSGKVAPTFTPDFLDAMGSYDWPGNIDQMGTVLSGLVQTKAGEALHREDFEAASKYDVPDRSEPQCMVRMVKLETMVQEHIRAVLLGCSGNKQKAAEVLGISRSTLYRMLDAGVPYLAKAS